jgi:hypothetical protein
MAFEMGDRKRLFFLVFMVVMVGLAAYVWYPRMFSKKPPVRRPPQVVRQEPPPLIEVVPRKPEPEKPAVQVQPPVKAKPPAPQIAKAPKEPLRAPAAPTPEVSARRYGLEFPPFVTPTEADDYERRLKAAGLPTLRTTASMEGGLYTLIVGPFPSAAKASEAMAELRLQPSSSREAEGGFVFGDGPHILREVVRRAQEVRGKGYGTRIVHAEGKASLYVIQTAARLDRAQADKLSSHYEKLGFPNRVVAGK